MKKNFSNLELELKLTHRTEDDWKESDSEILDSLVDGKFHRAILSTNKKSLKMDRKDNRFISSIMNVKLIYPNSKGGCLILFGILGCSFVSPFGGEFRVNRIREVETDYNSIKGCEVNMLFTSGAIDSIEVTERNLEIIANHPNFEFNINQFEEFMDIFEYYKTLSSELNNNISYKINSISPDYYFMPIDVKDFNSEYAEEILDDNGILKGYALTGLDFQNLPYELQKYAKPLVNVFIDGGSPEIKKIKAIGLDNIYISKYSQITENNVKEMQGFQIVNMRKDKDRVVISGELDIDDKDKDYYLNLYDMGQKIKVESIDNSLKLINQGASGSAVELLEYIIGDKPMPNYTLNPGQDPENAGGRLTKQRKNGDVREKYMVGLDESQKKAFLMATDNSPVSLIKGPPGTGKTHVINAIIQYITKELNEKAIITSQTHVAIDNVLDKLMENYDLIIPNRITNRRNKYSESEIDTTLYRTWGVTFKEHNELATDKKLAKEIIKDMDNFQGQQRFSFSENMALSDYPVIGATTTTSAIAGKKGLEVLDGYDWLIIDEVSKCPITEVLRYLPYVKKIIMVGDDYQLAPILEFHKDDVEHLPSYEEEKFERLEQVYQNSVFADTLKKAEKSGRLVLLNENYRSVKDVLSTYNVFYDDQLIGRRELYKPEKVHFKEDSILNVLNSKDITFVEVKNGREAFDNTSRYNIEEIDATAQFLKDILENTIEPEKVTVSAIFPYAAQISRFQKKNLELINQAKKVFKSFEIDTVDAFQGRETDIVLVNTVVTNISNTFLKDFRRINVSMSRAKDKLIIFGNSTILSKIEMSINGGIKRCYFKEIIDRVKEKGYKFEYDGGMNYEIKSNGSFKFAD